MTSGSASSVVKYIFGEVVGDFLYAPVWWYSRGFWRLLNRLWMRLVGFENSLGVRVWLKVFWKPMYGQRDLAGKIISFLMRLVVLIFRLVVLALYFIIMMMMALLWLAAPVVAVWQLVVNFIELLVT